jgi:ATP-dependent RNA helicase RhlE
VHRIGRTGRAGSTGEAVSLVCVDENGFLRDIERLIKHEIPKEVVTGFAPPPDEKPEPIVLGRMVIGEGAGRGFRPSGGGGRPGGGGGGGARHGGGSARAGGGGGGGAPRSGGGGSGSPRSGGGSGGGRSSPSGSGGRPPGTRSNTPKR